MDLSIVVASCRNSQGLFLTVFSAIQQLLKTNLSWEIIISADGGDPSKWDKIPNVRCLRVQTGSPQGTRDAGIRAAQSEHILCLEDHVIVSDINGLWEDHVNLSTFRHTGNIVCVPYRVAETSEFFSSFGYEPDWDKSFWNKVTLYNPKENLPYRISGFGHACFMISKSLYERIGGYELEMQGFGGEEMQLNALIYHMGGDIWMIPDVWHAHFLTAGAHSGIGVSEDYKRNFCIAAYESGGDEYLEKAQSYYNHRLVKTPAIEKRRQLICSGRFGGDLNKLRQYLKEEGI